MCDLEYTDFLKWALIKEPMLKIKEPLLQEHSLVNEVSEDRFPTVYGISEYTYLQTKMAFEDALNRCCSLSPYMREYNFKMLIFNYALHIAIVSSRFEVKKDDSGDIWNEPNEALQKLYVQYGVYSSTVGVVTSVSSGGSSSSSTLPKSITEGDLETTYLLSTPYGVQAEMYMEQLNGIII